ncbi:unnamed protein product [Closterium sp. NIES-54]
MDLPSNIPLPFLDLHCSLECAADCDGVHISWMVQETGGKVQQTVGATESCAPVLMGACTDDLTFNLGTDSLPVVPSTGNGMAESTLSGSVRREAFSVEGWTSLIEEALTDPSMPSGGGHVSALTQPSLAGQIFAPTTAAAAVTAPVSAHQGSHSAVNTSAAAATTAAAWPGTVPSAATSQSPPVHGLAQEELLPLRPAQAALTHPISARGASPAGLLVTNGNIQAMHGGTLFEAPREAPIHTAGGHTHDGTLLSPRGNTLAATHDGMLCDMILSGRFQAKGSSSWCNEDLIAEALAMRARVRQRLVGEGPGTKRPDSSTGTGSLIAATSTTSESGGSARVVSATYPRASSCFVDATGFSLSAPVIAGSAAVSPPPAAAAAAAAAEMASRGAAEPAQFAHSTWTNKGGSKRQILEQLPSRSKRTTEKLRRHRVSNGFKRLAKAIPASWMRQKQLKNFSSRTDMASLLHIAVEFIKDLQEQKGCSFVVHGAAVSEALTAFPSSSAFDHPTALHRNSSYTVSLSTDALDSSTKTKRNEYTSSDTWRPETGHQTVTSYISPERSIASTSSVISNADVQNDGSVARNRATKAYKAISCEDDLGGVGSLDATCQISSHVLVPDGTDVSGNGTLEILAGASLACGIAGGESNSSGRNGGSNNSSSSSSSISNSSSSIISGSSSSSSSSNKRTIFAVQGPSPAAQPDCSLSIHMATAVMLREGASLAACTLLVETGRLTVAFGAAVTAKGLAAKAPDQTSGTPTDGKGSGGGYGGRGASCSVNSARQRSMNSDNVGGRSGRGIRGSSSGRNSVRGEIGGGSGWGAKAESWGEEAESWGGEAESWGGDAYAWSTLTDPWKTGSKGGALGEADGGGLGGGRVRIVVRGEVVVEGRIDADGGDAQTGSMGSLGGGGSGGSVFVNATSM